MASTCESEPVWSRADRLRRGHGIEIGWWAFVLLNIWGILVFREWATVPFHFIWVGLSLLYGWRVWSLRASAAVLGVIAVLTGASLLIDVASGDQASDELTEIPLMSAVFIAMVYHVRSSVAAQRETERISEHNLALLDQGRRLVQDASHVLRTPLTIALGHAELLQRTTIDRVAADDAQVVIAELQRLKKTTDRLLGLAKSDQPDFLYMVETSMARLVAATATRWIGTHPDVRLGPVTDTIVSVDPDRVSEALDELIGNAVVHTPAGTPIEVSARRDGAFHVVAVADRGPGIPEALVSHAFERFVHGPGPSRQVGLGLAMVKAVAEGHGGRVKVQNRPGEGCVVEMWLPLASGTDESTDRLPLGSDVEPTPATGEG
jgi:signal transduction histidine kinase